MRAFVLTRSAYGPAWDLEANRRRLDVTRAVTVPSMAAQTFRDWTWVVAIDCADPLAGERREAFAAAGVPVRFMTVDSGPRPKDAAASAAYRAPWAQHIDRNGVTAMTRLDDDDGLAPWVLSKVALAVPYVRQRTALVFPIGIRVYRGRYTMVRHESNAMHTLVTLRGDPTTVYDYKHRYVREHALVRKLDTRPAWVWSRHDDTISGWRMSDRVLDERIMAMFPIDWSVFGRPEPGKVRPMGTRFR